MTVGQVHTKDALGAVLAEDGSEISYMFIVDGWLVSVIAQLEGVQVVSELEIVSLLEYMSRHKEHIQLAALLEALDL